MAGIAHRYHPHAGLPGLFNGDFHRLGGDDNAQAPVGVQAGGAGRFPDDADFRPGIDFPPLIAAQVTAEHIRNAVAVHAAQVGHGQHIRPQQGIRRGDAHFLKNGGHHPFQGFPRHGNGILQVDAESGQHNQPPLDGQRYRGGR